MAKNVDEMLGKIDTKLDEVADTIHKVDKELALQKAAFDEHIKTDEKMYGELRRMNDILQQNTESLREHMHRTELLESLVQKMDMRLMPIEREKIEHEAIRKYRNEKLVKYGKVIAIVGVTTGVIVALKPLIVKVLSLLLM